MPGTFAEVWQEVVERRTQLVSCGKEMMLRSERKEKSNSHSICDRVEVMCLGL